ncbi:MAG TPA: NADH-quinone oxidoreductase subunit NuoG [Nitrospiria bacterium]|nr:NADH-quinone oxidoreductase subunit NuoG [Nitrospiria bacterium]
MPDNGQNKKMVSLTINGQAIQVPEGTYLIEAAKKIGVEVPHFCYHAQLDPDANCRMCLVEIEKNPKLQTSCSMPAAQGMVVQTHSPNVLTARNGVIEFILSNHPLDCPICDKGGECNLQDLSHEYSKRGRFEEEKRVFKKEYFGAFIEKEMNRCVACLRCVRYCDEVMEVRALGAVNRGGQTEITTFGRKELDCIFCGGCVQICPVGALTSRLPMYQYRPWELKKTDTVCQHCADGCQITLETFERTVMRVTSEWGMGRNEGNLCAKGFYGYQYLNDKERLLQPHIRTEKKLVPALWDEALDVAASRINEVRSRYGNQAIAGIISARCSNEEIYLFQKWLRLAVGTPNIDSTARYGYISAARAFQETFGYHRMLNSYEEIAAAKTILLIGSDMSETNPVAALSVKKAVRKGGAKLLVIDPARTHLADLAVQHLQNRAGSEGWVVAGLLKALFKVEGNPKNNSAYGKKLKGEIENISWQKIEEESGLDEAALKKAAGLFHQINPGVILFGAGVTGGPNGYFQVKNLIDLAWLSGKLEGAGSGINALCYENNEMGTVDFGAAPEFLPGPLPSSDSGARKLLSDHWKGTPVFDGGSDLPGIIEKIHAGQIKLLYIVGENPLESLPASMKVREALEKLDFLICQEMAMTPTATMADVIFPAASYAEKEGTYTSMEGRVQKFRKALEPQGEARADWEIISEVSTRSGFPLEYENIAAIRREIRKILPDYYKDLPIDAERKEKIEASWKKYFEEKAQESLTERYHLKSASGGDGAWTLLIRPVLYHSGKMSRRSEGLEKLYPGREMIMNPEDGRKLGVKEGERVSVKSSLGQKEVRVRFDGRYPSKTVFYPQHLSEPNLRDLISVELDPVTRVPAFKVGKVEIEKKI